jgi:hypothetical protein
MLRLSLYISFLLSEQASAGLFSFTSSQTTSQLGGATENRKLPEGFTLSGTKSPTPEEKVALGLAHAIWDDHAEDPEQRGLGKKRGKSKKGKNKSPPRTNPPLPSPQSAEKLIIIPVYFHIFLNNANEGRMESNDVETGFISTLNKAMADTPFLFQFKSVTNTVNQDWFNCEDEETYKPQNRIGGPESLNVFVCDMATARNQAGSSNLPTVTVQDRKALDGITLLNPKLGYWEEISYQALVHEAGHWLGLFHTFEGGCSPAESNHGVYPSYYFAGDGVADTPAQAQGTISTPAKSSCWLNDNIDTCPDATGVDAGKDDVTNYMNYITPECFSAHGHFTAGQVQRMTAQYASYRAPLAEERFRI